MTPPPEPEPDSRAGNTLSRLERVLLLVLGIITLMGAVRALWGGDDWSLPGPPYDALILAAFALGGLNLSAAIAFWRLERVHPAIAVVVGFAGAGLAFVWLFGSRRVAVFVILSGIVAVVNLILVGVGLNVRRSQSDAASA